MPWDDPVTRARRPWSFIAKGKPGLASLAREQFATEAWGVGDLSASNAEKEDRITGFSR